MPDTLQARLGMKTNRLPGGPDKKMRSLKLILELIDRGKNDHRIRIISSEIINSVREGDYRGEVEKIADWIKTNVRYQRDPNGVETIADGWDTIKLGFGDCDDITVLAGAMLESIGQPTRVRVVGHEVLNHVFLDYLDGQTWRPIDLARPRNKIYNTRDFKLNKIIKKKEEVFSWVTGIHCPGEIHARTF